MERDISPPPTKKRRLEGRKSEELPSERHEGDVFSIFSWNINGISPFLQRSIKTFFEPRSTSNSKADSQIPSASLRDFLRRQNWPTVLCLQEVKINPDDSATKRAVEKAVRSPTPNPFNEPDYQAFFVLPSDPHNARGFGRKVYGVCTIVRADFLAGTKAKARTVDWDLEGRFSIIETEATADLPKLSIWNIYAVNGTTNPYKDPTTGKVTGTRHDRKLAVHKLLLEECLRLETEGYQVILAGDINIARSAIDGFPNLRTFPEQHSRNRADFNVKFFSDEKGLCALDTFRHSHPEQRGYTYYARGGVFGSSCDRVGADITLNWWHSLQAGRWIW